MDIKVKENDLSESLKYRHEFKYLCTDAQLIMLDVRLKGIMSKDIHAVIAGMNVFGTKPELGAAMMTRDGNEIPITAQGWNSLAAKE